MLTAICTPIASPTSPPSGRVQPRQWPNGCGSGAARLRTAIQCRTGTYIVHVGQHLFEHDLGIVVSCVCVQSVVQSVSIFAVSRQGMLQERGESSLTCPLGWHSPAPGCDKCLRMPAIPSSRLNHLPIRSLVTVVTRRTPCTSCELQYMPNFFFGALLVWFGIEISRDWLILSYRYGTSSLYPCTVATRWFSSREGGLNRLRTLERQ